MQDFTVLIERSLKTVVAGAVLLVLVACGGSTDEVDASLEQEAPVAQKRADEGAGAVVSAKACAATNTTTTSNSSATTDPCATATTTGSLTTTKKYSSTGVVLSE